MASPISSSPDTCAKVNVLVKNVYAPSQSKTFVVPITLSILELKHEIETVFPSMPAVKDQKLIFGGKICSNDTILDTILKQVRFMICKEREITFVCSYKLEIAQMNRPTREKSLLSYSI